MSKNLAAAKKYLEMGYSVIPVKPDKKPAIKWQPFQKRKATEKELASWFKTADTQVGIVTGEISGLTVVDIDSEPGKEVIEELVGDTFLTPIASTPRGGQHLYLQYVPEAVNRANVILGVDIRSDGGHVLAPPSQGANGTGYAWLEGLNPLQVSPAAAPARLHARIINNKDTSNNANTFSSRERSKPEADEAQGFKGRQEASPGFISFAEPGRDQTLFHLAWHLVKGNMPEASVRKYLDFFAANCSPPFPPKEKEAKVESALKRANEQNIDVAKEVFELVEASTGIIEASWVFKELHLASKRQRRLVQQALRRLADKGELLERVENARAGTYRRIDDELIKMSLKKGKSTQLPVKWPLELETLFCSLPKSIIVIAGDPDAGKTCFLLNFVRLNQHNHKIHYFNSEMGNDEMIGRLEKFDEPLSAWNFEPYERSANFADVIKPNDINICDYMEISENFYQVAGMLKRIHDKLKNGICIVALQKKRGQELGRGAEFGLEKPRLYLSLSGEYPGQRAKITKAENWQDPNVNPNGLQRKFKIIAGARIRPVTGWERSAE